MRSFSLNICVRPQIRPRSQFWSDLFSYFCIRAYTSYARVHGTVSTLASLPKSGLLPAGQRCYFCGKILFTKSVTHRFLKIPPKFACYHHTGKAKTRPYQQQTQQGNMFPPSADQTTRPGIEYGKIVADQDPEHGQKTRRVDPLKAQQIKRPRTPHNAPRTAGPLTAWTHSTGPHRTPYKPRNRPAEPLLS